MLALAFKKIEKYSWKYLQAFLYQYEPRNMNAAINLRVK